MKFGEFPVYDALGIELTHPVKCQEKTLKKGHILTSSDIGQLSPRNSGRHFVKNNGRRLFALHTAR